MPSSGLLCFEWTTWVKSSEPSGNMRRLSSEIRLMKVPSFFHSTRTGVASSLCTEQLSSAEFPRMASVSWGSTVNQKGVKGYDAEPDGQGTREEKGQFKSCFPCVQFVATTPELFHHHCNWCQCSRRHYAPLPQTLTQSLEIMSARCFSQNTPARQFKIYLFNQAF